MKKVLLSKAIAPEAMALLEERFDVVELPDTEVATVKRMIADADGMIVRTNLTMTAEIIEAATHLKVISRTGVGVDNVDIDAATKHGILVCNTPGVNANSVAEQTLALILATGKQLKMMDKGVREGNWKVRNSQKAIDLDGKTLGLVGVGRIGALVAQKCRLALNMKVIGYDPYVQEAPGIELRGTLQEIFQAADVVSVHVPYLPATHHLVRAELIAVMKPEALLINTSRGPVVDEAALTEALQTGKIAGAGLDVFEQEPPAPENPLLSLDNVVCTPHSSALSRECLVKVATTSAQAVVDALEGQEPHYVYNKKALQVQ